MSGRAALTDLEFVSMNATVAGGSLGGNMVICPSGKYAISGGIRDLTGTLQLYVSYPGQNPSDRWFAYVSNPTPTTVNLDLFAVCARPT